MLNTFGLKTSGFRYRQTKFISPIPSSQETNEKSLQKTIRGSKVEAVNMFTGHRIVLITEDEAKSNAGVGMLLMNVVMKGNSLIWCICDLDKG
jgi:hypothetical protein